MRWLKHLSSAHLDQRMIDLVSVHGQAGYGTYWTVAEIVAAKMEAGSTDTSVTHFQVFWAGILHESEKTVIAIFTSMENLGLATVSFSGRGRSAKISVDIPKLLKYRDEYSQKRVRVSDQDSGHDSGQPPDLPARARQNRSEQSRTDTTTAIPAPTRATAPEASKPSSSPTMPVEIPDKTIGAREANHRNGTKADHVINGNRIREMKSLVWGYMVPDGEKPESSGVAPPDEGILVRCLTAISDTPMERVYQWLRILRNDRDQGPGRPAGPDSYAWFPAVLSSLYKTGGPVR